MNRFASAVADVSGSRAPRRRPVRRSSSSPNATSAASIPDAHLVTQKVRPADLLLLKRARAASSGRDHARQAVVVRKRPERHRVIAARGYAAPVACSAAVHTCVSGVGCIPGDHGLATMCPMRHKRESVAPNRSDSGAEAEDEEKAAARGHRVSAP